ncbi:hypothetical protein YSY43_19520 [Paenibacillus sp. YSY-4.3]
MAYVIAASFISLVVSLIYLGYVGASFRQVKNDRRRELPAAAASTEDASEWESEAPFSWKAMISILLSSVILFLMGKSAAFWNYVPFIAIGSAVAVIFAFTIDLRKKV